MKTIESYLVSLAFIIVLLLTAISTGAAPQQATGASIMLGATIFTPALGEKPAIPPGLTIAGYATGERGYYLVQFQGPIQQEWKDQIIAIGAELLNYVPEFAFKVRMNPGQARRVETLANVEWVGLFHPAYKLSPDLIGEGTRLYTVRIERGAKAGLAVAAIAATGIQVVHWEGNIVTITAELEQLDAIAHILDVAWVDNFLLRKRCNEYNGGITMGGDVALGAGYDGSTQIVAVADTGIGGGTASTAHVDLPPGRIAAIYDWPGYSTLGLYDIIDDGSQDVDSGHGTHVALSVLGGGGPGGEGRGVAPGASLIFQSIENYVYGPLWNILYGNGYYLAGIPADLHELFQEAYGAGARIHSNSWGSAAAGAYTADSANTDDFIWNHPEMTITVAAGNNGIDADANGVIDLDSIFSPATAKNVISVGASEGDRQDDYANDPTLDYSPCSGQGGQNSIVTYGQGWPADFPSNPIRDDPSAGNPEQMAAFSGRGPTDDGRIKPDLVAPGTWLLSGYSDRYQQGYDTELNPVNGQWQYDGWGCPFNEFYKYMGGTSMATPLAAGAAAVVRDYYLKAKSHAASAALVKATLINAAVDMLDENNDGLDDNAIPIPNENEGWGRIDLAGAVSSDRQFVDEATGLNTGEVLLYYYNVDTPGSLLKISLVWSDYPSSEVAAQNLVNDLDLIVTSPTSDVYKGNVFSNGWSQTNGQADRTNNVENVYIEAATAGMWAVEVSAYNIPYGPQPFALIADVAASAVINNPPVAVDDSYATDEDTPLTVNEPGVLGNDSDADGDTLSAVLQAGTGTGVLSLNSNGSFTYTPNSGFSGADSFTYVANDGTANSNSATVTITVNTVNNAPVAIDDSYSTDENTALNQPAPGVLGNDSDADGDRLTAVLQTSTSNGAFTLNANGSFRYRPNTGFSGTDSFTYVANDGTANSNSATVTITVNTVNNAPVAIDDSYTTDENTVLNQPAPGVLGNDSDADGDSLSAVLQTSTSNGLLELDANGSFIYTPNTGFSGTDSFTYVANDGIGDSNVATVIISVNAVTPPATMHIGDLDGESEMVRKSKWRASVVVTIHSADHVPVAKATVIGTWSGGYTRTVRGVTDANGQCAISTRLISTRSPTATFTVDTVTHAEMTYDAGDNDSPAYITISKP